MPVICIGPICVPIWHVFVILAFLFKPIIRFFKRLMGIEVAEVGADDTAVTYTGERKPLVMIDGTPRWRSLLNEAESENLPVVVCFTAEWCKPCQLIAPYYEDLSHQFKALFCKVDVQEAPEVEAEGNVSALPTFQVWKKTSGSMKKCAQTEGAAKLELQEMLSKQLNPSDGSKKSE